MNPVTPRSLLRKTAEEFRRAGIPDPETDSALLLSSLCGRPPLVLRLDEETQLGTALLDSFAGMAARRMQREPLQYILGSASFCGRHFEVSPHVLIPRPETELLCAWALELIPPGEAITALDLCCGSGCIGLTLAAERPAVRMTLSDISAEALSVAAVNAARICPRVRLQQGDLLDCFRPQSFDLIVSNPPYIPSADCSSLQEEVRREPLLALDGGGDGLDFYRKIAAGASGVLKPGGILLLEIGFGQAGGVSSLLAAAGFSGIRIRQDLSGKDRMVLAVH